MRHASVSRRASVAVGSLTTFLNKPSACSASSAVTHSRILCPWWRRPALWLCAGVVGGWLALCWFLLRPERAVLDFTGWRQADTQSIAEALTAPGASVFLPSVRWGGASAGYVEAEFQGYSWLAAQLMKTFGPGEWAGQLVSLLATAVGLVVLWRYLERYGSWPATVGVIAALGARGLPLAATAIQPEALCWCLYVVAWSSWVRYLDQRRGRSLALFALAGALAMLIKPTAALLGIASGVLLLSTSVSLLKSGWVWGAWAFMLSSFAGYLWWAHQIYLDHGNTFGLLSGGDSKLPHLDHLLMPGGYLQLLQNAVLWGSGWLAAACLVGLALAKRLPKTVSAQLVGNAVWVLLAFRYTTHESWGVHYFLLLTVPGAEAVARAVALWTPVRRWLLPALLGVALLAGVEALWQRGRLSRPDAEALAVFEMGQLVAEQVDEHELIVVRSGIYAYDEFWRTPNNFQDPRLFYVAKARGWVLGSDQTNPQALADLTAAGADWYVETAATQHPPLERWLNQHAELVAVSDAGGRLFRLRPKSSR